MSRQARTKRHSSAGGEDASGGPCPTGIDGFDDITAGGLPRGRVTLALGGFGCGKTVFALQCLVNGARCHNEPGILVAFEERSRRIIANAKSFGWDLTKLERNRLFFLDAHLESDDIQIGDFTLDGLLSGIESKVRAMRASRIVFDGIDNLLDRIGDPEAKRHEMLRLHEWLMRMGLTAIITAKSAAGGTWEPGYGFMQYMVDCVVELRHQLMDRTAMRSLRVLKYRGGAASTNEFPMIISGAGIEVARHGSLTLDYPVSSERVSTGVRRLDAMLGGGIYRGTTALLSGQPGTAKSTLSGAFVHAACRRGERSLYISFDEAAPQIVRNLASIGIRIAPHLRSGRLHLLGLRSEAQSAEAHYLSIQALIREHRPNCLVIDPLSALIKGGGQTDSNDVIVRLLALAKASGITSVCTTLLQDGSSNAEATSLKVSTIADTWIHLANVAAAGERNRALTVVKSRGMAHSNQVRELILGDKGIELSNVYTSGGEVLMGTLRWAKESADTAEREVARLEYLRRRRELEAADADAKIRIESIDREISLRRVDLELLKRRDDARRQRRASDQTEAKRRRGGDSETPIARRRGHPSGRE